MVEIIKSIGLGSWLNLGLTVKEIMVGLTFITLIALIKTFNIRESGKW